MFLIKFMNYCIVQIYINMQGDIFYCIANVTSTVFESKDEPTQMTKQSFTIIDFITFRKSIHFKLICKNVHN